MSIYLETILFPTNHWVNIFFWIRRVISRSIEICSEEGFPINSESKVLEIGPGPGSLTLYLLRNEAYVFGIEIDEEAILHLDRVFGTANGQLEIISGDALRLNWPIGFDTYSCQFALPDFKPSS